VAFAKDVNFGVDAAGNSNANSADRLEPLGHGAWRWGKAAAVQRAQIDARQKILCDNAKPPHHDAMRCR